VNGVFSAFTGVLDSLLPAASPLLLASLGALVSEHAGVLAVFMDGAINFGGFVCIAVTGATGSPLAGVAAAIALTVLLLFAVSRFTERTGANPFLTALSVNLLSSGATSLSSSALFGTRGTVALADFSGLDLRLWYFPASLAAAAAVSFFLQRTLAGISLRAAGSAPEALAARGGDPGKYRTLSWCIAAFFAACAGSMLTLDLGAWVPNVSAGRGWTALAAVYLGYKNPWLCAAAVLAFAGAEYATNILQGLGRMPATIILGLPYALALVVFALVPQRKQ